MKNIIFTFTYLIFLVGCYEVYEASPGGKYDTGMRCLLDSDCSSDPAAIVRCRGARPSYDIPKQGYCEAVPQYLYFDAGSSK